MRNALGSCAVLAAILIPSTSFARSVVVIAHGSEAGRVQQQLNLSFPPSVTVLAPPDKLLETKAEPAKPVVDESEADKKIIREIAGKFEDADFDAAQARLGDLDKSGSPHARARMHLWKAAVGYQKDSDEKRAI